MDREYLIREVLVKNILETYKPWKDAELVECEVEHIEGNKDNFASITYSVILHLKETKNGVEIINSYPIFTKFMVDSLEIRESLQSEKQFFNEILWYSKVVPKFQLLIEASQNRAKQLNIFPKYYYSNYDVNDAVVAMEDLRPRNFCLGDRIALGVKYVEKALEGIARSHALAYRWRETDEENFQEVATSFKEATVLPPMNNSFKMTNERVMKALENDPAYADRVQRFREITASPVSLMLRLVVPEGPLATICHGDFCRNNVLFSKSLVNGDDVLDSILIDFQTARYASPAIDLSFFFFMSTTPELRAAEFDRLFKFYYDTIINELKALSGEEEFDSRVKRDEIFTLQAFKDDFAAHAVYGYLITANFLPIMMADDKARTECLRLWETDIAGYDECLTTLGGEPVTLRLVDTLKEILDRDYWPLEA